MKTYLSRLSDDIIALIKMAGALADERGETAYLVGGFVRDLILGVKNFDLDIVIEGDGIAFSSQFAGRHAGKGYFAPSFWHSHSLSAVRPEG